MILIRNKKLKKINKKLIMKTTKFELTQNEVDLIVFSLNTTWVNDTNKLLGHQLGDIERKYLEQTTIQTKELLMKIAGELDLSD